MKVHDKTKPKKGKLKKKDGVVKNKPKKEKVVVVAQEIKYARLLCSNEKKTRDRVLKALKKWLTACFEKNYDFKEEDFLRVWKGLFYAVWMSDKPLVQEELCENIAAILDIFPPEQITGAVLMMKAGFKTLATEWYGIDHHRMDKFLMLVRRYLRGCLRVLKRSDWDVECCDKFANMLADDDGIFALKTPHYARNATSMILHFTDCYLEEISKVCGGSDVPGAALGAVLRPALVYLCRGRVPALVVACRRLLTQLLRQSEPGIKHEEKIAAWKRMGCPEGGPDALETDDEESDDGGEDDTRDDVADDDVGDESNNKPLDPRAGRVNVELHPLPVPMEQIQELLRDELTKATSKAHTRIKICLDRVSRVMCGAPPLPLPSDVIPPPKSKGKRGRVKSLVHFEQKLNEEADELRLRGLSRKHRKRLLRKSRSGLSIVEDVEKLQTDTHTNGKWKVETLKEDAKDTSDKENQNKKKNKQTNKRKTEQSSPILNKKPKLDIKNKNNEKKLKDKNLNKKDSTDKKEMNDKVSKTDKTENQNKDTEENLKKHKNLDKKELKVKNKQIDKKESLNNNSRYTKTKSDEAKQKPENQNTESKNKTKDKKTKPLGTNTKENKNTAKNENVVQKSYKFDINRVKIDKKTSKTVFETPKKVKFALKNNSMQKPIDYYKSVRQSPNIPFDSSKKPSKTNLKPCTPSPINPFFKKKLRIKK